MQYGVEVTCKKCYETLSRKKVFCNCGNVAISYIPHFSNLVIVYTDDLKSVQFVKKYKYGLSYYKRKLLFPNYKLVGNIISDLSIRKFTTFDMMLVSPKFIFSGRKLWNKFKDWIQKGKIWAKEDENYEGVYRKPYKKHKGEN